MSGFVATGFMVGIIVMIFWTPAVFAKGVYKITYGELSNNEKVYCLIPIYNIIKAEKIYTGKVSTVGISMLVMVLTLVARLLVVFLIPSSYICNVITVVLFLISIVAYLLTNMILVWRVLSDADTNSLGSKLAMSIFFPLGQYYIGNFLTNVLKHLAKEEEVFK